MTNIFKYRFPFLIETKWAKSWNWYEKDDDDNKIHHLFAITICETPSGTSWLRFGFLKLWIDIGYIGFKVKENN